jgi:hypothetical protein
MSRGGELEIRFAAGDQLGFEIVDCARGVDPAVELKE